MGIVNKSAQERLLRESDLTLDAAVKLCRASKISKQQCQALHQETVMTHAGKQISKKTGVKSEPGCGHC